MKTSKKENVRIDKSDIKITSEPKMSAFGKAMRKYSGTGKIVDMRAVM